ncbi:MAG: 5'/3'-nucleotidase SurE [Cyanobacteria bacterium P01_F01_bin.150]
MTLLLTNDDGIDAPGIYALQQAVEQSGKSNVYMVAPKGQASGCSHQLTRGGALTITPRSSRAFAVDGTPADCTRIALAHLATSTSLVLSGINAGGNLGADVYVSGTVAAVREAVLHRIPGIAISHYIRNQQPIDWERASRLTARVLDKLLATPIPDGTFWNVNLPSRPEDSAEFNDEPDIIECPLCTQPLPIEHRVDGESLCFIGRYDQRPRDKGADVDVCFSGNIAITSVRLW